MLKSFKEQNIDANKEVSDAIDAVVDNWVKELLSNVVASPMSPETKRSLWDRFKGSLANIWYGGKYNPKNPYYWKHRFGDELGSTTESFDPSVFTLYEYHDLKSAVDRFESVINEQNLPQGAEKLKLVQVIKSAAEALKRDLKNVFMKSTEQQPEQPQPVTTPYVTPAQSVDTAGLGIDIEANKPPTPIKRGRGRPRKNPLPASKKPPTMPVDAPESDSGSTPPKMMTLPPKYEVGNETRYKDWLPKEENIGRSLNYLKKNKQYVDWILHPDFNVEHFYDQDSDSSIEAAAKLKIKNLEKLKTDAEKMGESQPIIDKINDAMAKMKKFYET